MPVLAVLCAVVTSCGESDKQAERSPVEEPAPAVSPKPPVEAEAEPLSFFGYELGMARKAFLERAKADHAFELKPLYGGTQLVDGGEGTGEIAGLEVSGRFAFANGELREFSVLHETTEPVPLIESPLFAELSKGLGAAEGCAGDSEATSCTWKSGMQRVELSIVSHWPKGASEEHHEYKVRAHIEEPPRDLTPDERLHLALQQDQKEREAAIKKAIMKAGAMLLDGKAVLRPSASECLWKLNGEDPPAAFEAAKCIDRAETFIDLKACTAPCRPPDPSLTK